MRLQLVSFAFLAVAGISACSSPETAEADSPETESSCEDGKLTVSDAWIRASRTGRPTTAAYLTLCNGSGEDQLLSVDFPGAGAVELHKTLIREDGAATMAPVMNGVALPAGKSVELAPGGAHIMLIGVTRDIPEGGEVVMTLNFAHSPPMDVPFEVRGMGHEGH